MLTETKTILVVDDDEALRQGLTTVLAHKGYRTLEADDGAEARHLIDAQSPDLVILDMMMPNWGGLAVLEHFRDREGTPPFIMITAHEGQKHKSYAERLGVLDYVHKPFSMERLLESVVKAVPVEVPSPRSREAVASIRCRCPGCGSKIKAPLELVGRTRTCPGCRLAFVVKLAPPEDEGTRLVVDE